MRLLPFLALFLAQPLYGAWHAVLLGGSGEKEEVNFFIEDLRRLKTELSSRGWQVKVVAGSRPGLVGNSLPAHGKAMLKAVSQTVDGASKNDQLFIVIHSHGREREASLGQRTHSIVSEDAGPEGSDLGFDLDRLAPLLKKARSKGVTTAVVDLSCYSGTIHALTDAACTLSLAATDYVSSCSGRPEERLFTSFFFDLPAGAVTLEQQFLNARAKDKTSINLPQISSRITPQATAWTRLLTDVDPLDVYGDLETLTSSPTPDARLWQHLGVSVSKLQSIREQIHAALLSLRTYHEGPIRLLRLGGREVPVTPGRFGDWVEQLSEKTNEENSVAPSSDVEKQWFEAMQSGWTELELTWAEFANPYLQEKKRLQDLKAQLADEAGALFAQERILYESRSTASGRSPDCRTFQLSR